MESVIKKFEELGQGHVFAEFSTLSAESQQSLLFEASQIDMELLASLYSFFKSGHVPEESNDFSPFPNIFNLESASADHKNLLQSDGLRIISRGEAAVITFAGGQGTRLGVPYPKGMYDIGLISHKTLLQIFAERLIRLKNLAGPQTPPIPWLIMVNWETYDLMVHFFESNNYFGLDKNQVFFFKQDMLPAIDFEGKIIMNEKDKICMAPNGNGGVYEGLLKAKALDWLEGKGVRFVHVCGIDNVLVKVCDPAFLAFADNSDAEVSTKVVEKVSYNESMGVLGLRGGKQGIIEYSELSEEMAKLVDENGKLVYFGGNILNHVFKVSFLRRITSSLELLRSRYHIARKKVPFYSAGTKTTPKEPNGVKFELFYFDVFSLSTVSAAMEIQRSEEFAPVKNATGADSPESARKLVSDLNLKWLKKAGACLNNKPDAEGCCCEISPLISYSGEGLDFLSERKITLPFYLYY